MLQSWLRDAASIKLTIKLPAIAPEVAPSELPPEPSMAAASAAEGIYRGINVIIVEFLLTDKPSSSTYFSTFITILSYSGSDRL